MPAAESLQRRQFGPPKRSISPDDVNEASSLLLSHRHALLEKPGEYIRSPRDRHDQAP